MLGLGRGQTLTTERGTQQHDTKNVVAGSCVLVRVLPRVFVFSLFILKLQEEHFIPEKQYRLNKPKPDPVKGLGSRAQPAWSAQLTVHFRKWAELSEFG